MAEINRLTNLTSPVGTESIPVEEEGGTLKRILVSWFAKASWFDESGNAKSALKLDRLPAMSQGSTPTSLTSYCWDRGAGVTFFGSTVANTALTGIPANCPGYFNIETYGQTGDTIKIILRDALNYTIWECQVSSTGNLPWVQLTDASGNPIFPSVSTTASAANAYIGANGTTILKSTSSRRYKTNILPLSDSVIIDSMKPITYTSDPDTVPTDDPDLLHYGFIAEDLAEIDPKLVQYTEDAEGNLIPDGVQYDRITVLLVKRIQELEARLKKAGI